MEIVPYLAITGKEAVLPQRPAWMACRFAQNGTGLENIPQWLPPGAVLMVDDSREPNGHDPEQITQELQQTVQRFQCSALLLDFQQPNRPQTAAVTQAILNRIPNAVVSEPYATGNCGILLPPVPLTKSTEDYLSPWQGREIWLETTLDALNITVTEQGSTLLPCPLVPEEQLPHEDASLHCHYRLDLQEDTAVFHLQRTKSDLLKLIAQVSSYVQCIGFYGELTEAVIPSKAEGSWH